MQYIEVMISFSIDKQSGKVNVERMSRPVDSIKNKTKDQPPVLVLTSAEQSPTFASRLKKETFGWPKYRGSLQILNPFYLIKRIGFCMVIVNVTDNKSEKDNGSYDFEFVQFSILSLEIICPAALCITFVFMTAWVFEARHSPT